MKSFFSKWYIKLILWFGTCGAIIAVGIFAVGRMVYSSVCIDANPSITVKLDKDGFVLTVVGENEDGKEVLRQLEETYKEDYEESIKGQDAETIVSEIVYKALELDYLNDEQSAMLLSVKSRDEEVADELQFDLAYVASDAMESELDNAVVLDQTITADSSVRAISGIYHISQGKAFLVWQLCMSEPELQVWDLADMTITELILECIDKDVNLAEYVDIIGEGLEDFYSDYDDEDLEEGDEYYDNLPAPDFDEDYEDDDFESDYADDYSTVDDDFEEDWEDEDEDTELDLDALKGSRAAGNRGSASAYDTSDDDDDELLEEIYEEDEEDVEDVEEADDDWGDDYNEGDYPDEQLPGEVYYDDGT